MFFREATVDDIPQLHHVRVSVRENRLSNPDLISAADYENFLARRGKGWVCEIDSRIAGFAIADLQGNNVWALFLLPEFERKGIGRKLHELMLDWYFAQTKTPVWLSTSPNTRAENFYRKAGWKETDVYGKGEIKFEMPFENWNRHGIDG